MKVLVIGRSGQVARALIERAAGRPHLELVAVGRSELDLERPGSVEQVIADAKPDLVINCAAYTSVDQAEHERERAFRINGDGAGEVAAAAVQAEAAVIQLSTDYVFDGTSEEPYSEDAVPNPVNVYGLSKLAGERAVGEANARHLIVRTSWLFSPFGRNFVKTMLSLAGKQEEVAVVADQRGCPTSALDLADAILTIADRAAEGNMRWGRVLHIAGEGNCSWAEFADAIFSQWGQAGGPTAAVRPIATADYPTAARRPRYSVLDCSRFAAEFGGLLPHWRIGTAEVVGRLTRRP